MTKRDLNYPDPEDHVDRLLKSGTLSDKSGTWFTPEFQ